MQDVPKSPRPAFGKRSAVWAWACVALVPVAVLVALVVAWSGLADSVGGIGLVALVVALVAAPVAGLVLALRARRAGRRSGTAAAVVSGVLLAVVLVLVGGEVLQILTYKVPTVRAPAKTAFVVAYGGGCWFEVGSEANAPRAVFHDAGTPIPADYDVAVATGWRGTSLDRLESASQIKIRIPEAGVDLSFDRETNGEVDSGAYWGGPSLYDEYWVRFLYPITGFEPQGEAQVYADHWWVGLTDTAWEAGLATNLTAEKKLPQGTYTVYFEESIPATMTGLDCVYDGPQAPYHPESGTNVTAPYTFTVGPPVQ